MFELITLGQVSSSDGEIDAGLLAECLLFYEKVRVITTNGSFQKLVQCCGPDELLELCEMGCLEIEFLDNMAAIISKQTTVGECHDMGAIATTGIQFPQIARKAVELEVGGSCKRANKLFDKFNRVVTRSQYTAEILKGAQGDLKNKTYLEQAAKEVLAQMVPDYSQPYPLIFRPQFVQGFGYRYDTNIDFDRASDLFRKRFPGPNNAITPAQLLLKITSTEPDLIIASKNGSEFALDPVKSRIVSSRFASIIQSQTNGNEKINAFQELVIDDSRSVREVVNSGERTFRDVIILVKKAERFKEWARGVEDGKLRDEYCKTVATVDWADKLPAKEIRFLTMTGLSVAAGFALTPVVGAAIGVGLNAADYFLLDRILKGWRPSQFVQGHLRTFVAPDDSRPPSVVSRTGRETSS